MNYYLIKIRYQNKITKKVIYSSFKIFDPDSVGIKKK